MTCPHCGAYPKQRQVLEIIRSRAKRLEAENNELLRERRTFLDHIQVLRTEIAQRSAG